MVLSNMFINNQLKKIFYNKHFAYYRYNKNEFLYHYKDRIRVLKSHIYIDFQQKTIYLRKTFNTCKKIKDKYSSNLCNKIYGMYLSIIHWRKNSNSLFVQSDFMLSRWLSKSITLLKVPLSSILIHELMASFDTFIWSQFLKFPSINWATFKVISPACKFEIVPLT